MKKILLTLSFFICLIIFNSENNIKAYDGGEEKVISLQNDSLNEKNIYIALIMNDIKYPEVVLSQIMIETGNLTSKLCKINNNLLGMTVPSKRETTALNNKGFAKYENWFSSILDYKLYQDFVFSHKNITNKKQYIAYLHKNYAKSPTYKNKLTNLSNKYELRNSYNIMFYTNL